MKLILVRHAAAIDESAAIADDRRYLTAEGRAYFRKTARTMRRHGITFGLILTSPLIRAVQTAEILAERVKYGGELIVADDLEPGFGVPELERLLATQGDDRTVCLVGHEPDLSRMVITLLGLPGACRFRKGTAVGLDVNTGNLRGAARFEWLAAGKKLIATRDQALA